MKKIIAGKRVDGVWIPQQEVDMDAQEEAHLISCQKVNQAVYAMRCDLTDRQKLDMLLNEGPEKTKKAIADIEVKKQKLAKNLEVAKAEHAKIEAKYVKSRGK